MLLLRSRSPAVIGGVGAAEGRDEPDPDAGDEGTARMLLLRSRSPGVNAGVDTGKVEAGCIFGDGTTRMLLCRSRSRGSVDTGEGKGESPVGADVGTTRMLLCLPLLAPLEALVDDRAADCAGGTGALPKRLPDGRPVSGAELVVVAEDPPCELDSVTEAPVGCVLG